MFTPNRVPNGFGDIGHRSREVPGRAFGLHLGMELEPPRERLPRRPASPGLEVLRYEELRRNTPHLNECERRGAIFTSRTSQSGQHGASASAGTRTVGNEM
jgi:hypothetical protein